MEKGKIVFGSAKLAVALGLLFVIGCSQQNATGSSDGMARDGSEAGKFRTSADSASAQLSSLEAYQQGTTADGPLSDVYFAFDRYDLSPAAKATLERHAGWLKTNPNVLTEVEGHGDERGTNDYNLALGAKRAESAKRYLMDLGIERERMTTLSYGEELPLCKEHSEGCWAKNRRAHFVVKNFPAN
jgi:peptidoglycan-associated lipoprotein